MKAWHFLHSSGALRYGDGRRPEVGRKLRCAVHKVRMCEYGFHGSVKALDALGYAPGPIACRVEMGGFIKCGCDKVVASERTILKMIDATKILDKFARLCALDVVHLWDAPEVVVRYLKCGEEREEAYDAADDAYAAAANTAAAYAARAEYTVDKQNQRLVRMLNKGFRDGR